MSKVYIGTSGWVYKGWQKEFYPAEIPAREQFQFYTTQFPTVEINATFYRLPTLKTVRGWRDKAPKGFVFAVKGSRFITHIQRLNTTALSLRKFFNRIKPMRDCTGPVLWQLPPTMKKDLPRLDKFLARLPKALCHAVEFRHPSWYEDGAALEVLRRHHVAHVSLSSQRMAMDLAVTAGHIYIRFHGLAGGPSHDYTRAELEPWAKFIRQQAAAGKNVYTYFNNDLNVRAPNNAKVLMEMVGEAAVEPLAAAAVHPSIRLGSRKHRTSNIQHRTSK